MLTAQEVQSIVLISITMGTPFIVMLIIFLKSELHKRRRM